MSAVLRVERVTKTYPSAPPVTALREVSLTVDRRGAGGGRRPVGVGQDHAAAPDGQPGPAHLRHACGSPGWTWRACPTGSWPRCARAGSGSCSSSSSSPSTPPCSTTSPTGCSTPGVPVRAAAATRRARRWPRSGSADRLHARPTQLSGGRAAAGRDRPRPGRPPGDRAGRRAHRQPRPGHRAAPSSRCSRSCTPPAPRSS